MSIQIRNQDTKALFESAIKIGYCTFVTAVTTVLAGKMSHLSRINARYCTIAYLNGSIEQGLSFLAFLQYRVLVALEDSSAI